MIRKALSLLLAAGMILCCLLPCAAQNETGPIAVKLNSDIAGLTESDWEKLIELKSANVVCKTAGGGPVLISDFAGSPATGKLVAGRTYDIYYTLSAADGYTLPDRLDDDSIRIDCGKGVTVYSKAIVTAPIRNESGEMTTVRNLQIHAGVVADGNLFQRLVGMIHDYLLKIKAWSLY